MDTITKCKETAKSMLGDEYSLFEWTIIIALLLGMAFCLAQALINSSTTNFMNEFQMPKYLP